MPFSIKSQYFVWLNLFSNSSDAHPYIYKLIFEKTVNLLIFSAFARFEEYNEMQIMTEIKKIVLVFISNILPDHYNLKQMFAKSQGVRYHTLVPRWTDRLDGLRPHRFRDYRNSTDL